MDGDGDFDLFDFWADLQYGDDEYWDNEPSGMPTAGQKTKRTAGTPLKPVAKRRLLSLGDTDGGLVRFVPTLSRIRFASQRRAESTALSSFALLPDWRDRFAGTTGLIKLKAMPVEMKKAAESKEEDTPPKVRLAELIADEDDDDRAEGEGELEDEAEEPDAVSADMDQNDELLHSVLAEKLRGTPLEGMDNGMLMQIMGEMKSGGGDGNALDVLTNSLLGKATEGNDMGVSGWLSQQGVALDADDGAEDGDEISTTDDMAPSSSSMRRKLQSSPQDSAIGPSQAATKEMPMHGSSPCSSSKKRSAPSGARDNSKKRKVVFDVAEEGATSHGPSTTRDEASTAIAHTNSEVAPAEIRPRQTRKRKAVEEDPGLNGIVPSQKRQARKMVSTVEKDAPTPSRRIRSTRATAGK